MNQPVRRFVAWVGHTSIAVGPTVEDVVSRARDIIGGELWQRITPGFPDIRVTTYGSQRHVKDGIPSAADAERSDRPSGARP